MTTRETVPGPSLGLMLDYPHQPYSFVNNSHLETIHAKTLVACARADDLSTVQWLAELATFSKAEALGYEALSDNNPDLRSVVIDDDRLAKTHALLTYTAAKAEHLLRIQSVRDEVDTDRGVSTIVSGSLAKLSNAYRLRYELSKDSRQPDIVIAHTLAMYALRFNEPDSIGYRQSMGHWLQLGVRAAITPKVATPEKLVLWEETLRLAISLEELGPGPQHSYVGKHLVPHLLQVFEVTEQPEEYRKLEEHFKEIPVTGDEEPEQWFARKRKEDSHS